MEGPKSFIIEPLTKDHWPLVEKIYIEGIETKMATFQTRSPGWEDWNDSHHSFCRYVISDSDGVKGWAALLPVSKRKVYRGVAEVSIYITNKSRAKGLGKKLLQYLIQKSENNNIWTLQASLFPENKASFKLLKSLGFREVGYREKIGQLEGIWRNTILMERRSNSTKYE